jgi:8-oxo-dGTP diphosphatase
MSYCYEYPHPAVTTDVVAFTVIRDDLQVLLIRRARPPYRGAWALPGGFINPDETLKECACRELEEETGIAEVFMEQLHTFSDPDRDPRERVITTVYYTLVPPNRREIRGASDAAEARWFDLEALPPLAFDHAHIVRTARARLLEKLEDPATAYRLVPAVFTLSDLQRVHEAILGVAIDKRNFRKKILGQGFIEETGEKRQCGAHRPAMLYRVKE